MSKGHLIIHDISEKEADKLMKKLKNKTANWWTQENINRLDAAASFAMITHGYPYTTETKSYNNKEEKNK